MIRIETDRTKCLYCRTNRRVKWQYADYGGRYKTTEEAIKKASERYGEQPYEYRIEDLDSDEVITGKVNWK